MAGTTTKLALYLPGGGLSGLITPDEQVDIDKINDNMKKIDIAMGSVVCTSGTRPSTPYTGQTIIETDTRNTMYWTGARWAPMDLVPNAGSSTIRDVLYPAPVAGNQVLRIDRGRIEQYFAVGVGGRTTAGWYQTSGNPEVGVFIYNAPYGDSSATVGLTTVEKSNGFVTVCLNATKGGTVTTGDQVGTLPVGFRPRPTQSRVDFAGGSNTASSQNYIARDNGIINVYNPIASPTGAFGTVTFKALDTPVAD